MKKTGKRQEEQSNLWAALIKAVGKGSALALILTLGLLFLCAAAVSARWLSQGAMDRAAMAVCVLGGLTGGAMALRGHRELALPLGLGVGLGLFVLLAVLGLLLYDQAPEAKRVPGILCACLCGGGAAGMLGRKTKKKRRR